MVNNGESDRDRCYENGASNYVVASDAENADANFSCDDVLRVYSYACDDVKNVNVSQWLVEFKIVMSGETIEFRIDTQADCSVMAYGTYMSLAKRPVLQCSNVTIRGVGGNLLRSLGCITLPVEYKGVQYEIQCEVLDVPKVPNILSETESVKMNLIKRVNEVQSISGLKSAQAILDNFSDVFQGVGKIPGEYALICNPDAKPVAHPPRPVPAALREQVKRKLDQLEEMKIIEKVPVGQPSPWCSPLHVVPKKSSKPDQPVDVRITIDPQDLNRALMREYHPIMTFEDVTTRTHGSKFFTALDANMGYFQISLTEDSRHLTVFNTPFGRYQYLRLPMGISPSPEIYQRAVSELFHDIDGVEIIMDDILIHAPTIELHNNRLRRVLERCREKNLRLNPGKTKLCASEIEYVGHKLTADGVKISDDKVKAVLEMPEPSCIEHVRTLIGMVTYTCKFLPHLSATTEPLRQLIKDSASRNFKFHFDQVHREAFFKLKQMMSTAPVLRYYSLNEPVVISCDASQAGLGAVIFQGGKPVAYASKSLTTAEYAYAQIEKELLAIVFACKKFHSYIYGRTDVVIETDHLPLVRIIEKPLHQVPLRLQRMRMTLQQYSFKLVGKSGKDIPVADALSRAFLKDTYPNLMEDHFFSQVYAVEVRGTQAFSTRRQEQLAAETGKDVQLQQVIRAIQEGWSRETYPMIKHYYQVRDELSVIDGIVFKGDRVVIPSSMRKEMLDIIHETHQGLVRSKQLARDIMFWPGMNSCITDVVNNCIACQNARREQQREPLLPSEVPTGPWKVLAADLLHCVDSNFLVVIDYYSEFMEVEELKENTLSSTVIERLAKMFAVHGIPEKLITDNAPQFSSFRFQEFAVHWNFKHITTSPHHHQANGMVERANQTIRRIFEKVQGDRTKAYFCLLHFRNTPKATEAGSPVQRLFGRRTRTKLPVSEKLLKPQTQDPSTVRKVIEQNRGKAKEYYDRGTKSLPPLQEEDTIRVRKNGRWEPARLTNSQPQSPRSYNVETQTGTVLRRNRRHLLRTNEGAIFNRKPPEVDFPSTGDLDVPAVPTSPARRPAVRQPPPAISPFPPQSVVTSRFGRPIHMPKRFQDYVT